MISPLDAATKLWHLFTGIVLVACAFGAGYATVQARIQAIEIKQAGAITSDPQSAADWHKWREDDTRDLNGVKGDIREIKNDVGWIRQSLEGGRKK